MIASLKLKAKSALKSYPSVFKLFKKVLQPTKPIHELFKTELALLEGTHQTANQHPSVIHFSFNKAATQYIKAILKRCAIEKGMTNLELNAYSFNSNFPYLQDLTEEAMAKYKPIFKQRGYLYGPFGRRVKGVDPSNHKIVLVVRDPRDLLVSYYYSMGYSHTIPPEDGNKYAAFMQRRQKVQETSIDDFVLEDADRILGIYQSYEPWLADQNTSLYITKYEDMVKDFAPWLSGLLNYCEFDISRDLWKALITENEMKKPSKENLNSHIRKGVSGDYKEKLKPETIEVLNGKLQEMLTTLDYEIE